MEDPAATAPTLSREERRRLRRRRRLLRRIFWWSRLVGVVLVGLLALGLLGIACTIRHYEGKLPTVTDLKTYSPPQVSRILARDGTVLGEVYVERRTVVPISEIAPVMRDAILAAEDASFYEHAGLNYWGMLRALWVNVRSHKLQGGSTITQQVVKNVLLSPERTFDRKVKEVILARRLEQELTKDEILELYLNQILFGHGRWGVEEGARFYFGKSAKELRLSEAALLAGIVKGPGVYSPRVNMTRALQRRTYVLEQMKQKGFASAADVEAAMKEPIVLSPDQATKSELAPEVVTLVEKEMRQLLGEDWEKHGYTITTTIDPVLQTAAREALRKALGEYDKRHKNVGRQTKSKKEPAAFAGQAAAHKTYRGVVTKVDDVQKTVTLDVGDAEAVLHLEREKRYDPDGLPPSAWTEPGKVLRVTLAEELTSAPVVSAQGAKKHRFAARLELGPEGAMVVLDPKTREVLAWVGGWDAARAGFDRAAHAKRQPGSTMKTFVYGYGIESKKLTGATLLETSREALPVKYRPQNYDGGDDPDRRVPMRTALAKSVNVSAVWALDKIGTKGAVDFAAKAGVKSPAQPDLSFALGSYEVTPGELTNAYATLAAGGAWAEPRMVLRITGPDGADVPILDAYEPKQVMTAETAYVMTSMLRSVVTGGTGSKAAALGRPIAGKTGTSNHARDAWFVGYSTSLVCGVWIGFDDGEGLGNGEAGGATAVPGFVELMKKAHAGKKSEDFVMPPGVVRRRIDPATGMLAGEGTEGAFEEVFVEGTEPKEEAPPAIQFQPLPGAPSVVPSVLPSARPPTLVAKPG